MIRPIAALAAVRYRTDALPFSYEDNEQPVGYTVDRYALNAYPE